MLLRPLQQLMLWIYEKKPALPKYKDHKDHKDDTDYVVINIASESTVLSQVVGKNTVKKSKQETFEK